MILEELLSAIKQARQVVESFKANIGPVSHPVQVIPVTIFQSLDPVPICPPSILFEITRLTEVKLIWIPTLGKKPSVLRAAYLNYGQEAYALTHESENRCWTRYLLCKEFMQVMLQDANNLTSNPDATKDLIKNLLLNAPTPLNPAAVVDEAACFAAMELLLPREHATTYREFRDYEGANAMIAKSFLVPEEIVAIRFSPAVIEFFESCYQELDRSPAA